MLEWLQYESEHILLICKYHRYAISNLSSHLRIEHSRTPEEKAAVASNYSHLQISNPAQVQLPPPLEPPLRSPGRPRDAFICDKEECKFITISRHEILKHCKRKHKWRSTKADCEHFYHVYVQSFVTTGDRQRYFAVGEQEQSGLMTVDRMADACRLFPWADDRKVLAKNFGTQ
jgi:hypothetical protein